MWHLAVLSFVLGVADGFFYPAYSAWLPALLPAEQLLAANGVEGVLRPVAQNAAGPALASLLIAVQAPWLAFLVVGGLQVVGGRLIGGVYEYYDGELNGVDSHFTLSSLNLASANVQGLFQVGNLGGGYVGGYMAPIPAEWQAALGAPYLTGQAALNKGWLLHGGPTYAFDAETKTMRCGQAVFKEVDGVDYDPGIKLGDY